MEDEKIDFDMNTNKDEFKTGKNTYLDTLFSVTELFLFTACNSFSSGDLDCLYIRKQNY